MVVLDVMLRGMDGLENCQRLRRGTDVPILVLTARDAGFDRIAGLDRGADDYLSDKLEADGEVRLIQTVRGVGYALREDER